MTRHRIAVAAIFTGMLLGALALPARSDDDWPQFRGPHGEATSTDRELPTKWSSTENIRWKTELPGRGISSPVIAGGRIYLTAVTGFEQSRLHVLAFDASGKQLWDRQIWSTHYTSCHPTSCMAANTAVTDGDHVYAFFGTGDLLALDRDGVTLWYRSLGKDYPEITNQVGMAASPVLAKNAVVVPMENSGDSFVLAVNKDTGENLWKVPRPRNINWITPLILESKERTEVVVQSDKDVTSYAIKGGTKLWTSELDNPAPVPALLHVQGVLYAPGSEYTALQLAKTEAPTSIWTNNKIQSGYTSPVYHDGRIYYVGRSVVCAVDAKDGSEVARVRIAGKRFWSSPVIGAGKLYITSEEGTTSVVELGDKLKVMETNELADTILATPALVNGAFYIRSDKYLYCIGGK